MADAAWGGVGAAGRSGGGVGVRASGAAAGRSVSEWEGTGGFGGVGVDNS